MTENNINYKLIFESMPGSSVLFDVDAPKYTILATTNEYVRVSGKAADELIGRSVFESFPKNPAQAEPNGPTTLKNSLDKVLATGTVDVIPVQRYDIVDNDGHFQEYYWEASSKPIFDNGKVRYILHTAIDVTAKINANIREGQLKGYEPAYNLFMQAPVAIAVLKGPEMIIEMANDPMRHVWGKGHDVINKPFRKVLPELEKQGLYDVITEVRTTGNPYYGFEQHVTLLRNGVEEDTYFTFFYQPYYEDDLVAPAGIMIFANEVTDKVLRTQKIQEQEEKSKQMLLYRKALLEAHNEASLDGILLVDAGGKIVSWNQRFLDIWELPVEMLKRAHDDEALKVAMTRLKDPDAFIKKVKELYAQQVETSSDILEFENGKLIERQGYPVIGDDGTYFAWCWTFRDVTKSKAFEKELLKSETRYRELTESLEKKVAERTDKLFQLNETHRFAEEIGNFGSYRYEFETKTLTYSDNLYRLLGCKPQEFKACPETFLKYIHPDDRQYVIEATTEAFDRKEVSRWEYRVIRKNGETIYVRGTGNIVTTANGRNYMIGTLQDISDEKEHERQLKEKNEALQNMNRELESFAYISSHDLQEPLRKIQTFASRIIDGEFENMSDSGKQYFEKIQSAALRMQTLIDDLLAYSRTSSEDRTFEVINLGEIMGDIEEELSEEIGVYRAQIVLGEMVDVKIIPFQFRQIMHNLIGNALKFSRREVVPTITVTSRNAPGEAFSNVKLPPNVMYCHISVSDNGIGFDDEYSEKIFEVFQRLHSRDKYNGTGIGLAIVKKIIDNHEGIITAKGKLGEGAVFDIYIPSA